MPDLLKQRTWFQNDYFLLDSKIIASFVPAHPHKFCYLRHSNSS